MKYGSALNDKGIINAGVYIFSIAILDLIKANQFSSLEDNIFPLIVKSKKMNFFQFTKPASIDLVKT